MTTMLNKDNQDRGFFILHSPKPELLKTMISRQGWVGGGPVSAQDQSAC
jgi:hypothetical protein